MLPFTLSFALAFSLTLPLPLCALLAELFWEALVVRLVLRLVCLEARPCLLALLLRAMLLLEPLVPREALELDRPRSVEAWAWLAKEMLYFFARSGWDFMRKAKAPRVVLYASCALPRFRPGVTSIRGLPWREAC